MVVFLPGFWERPAASREGVSVECGEYSREGISRALAAGHRTFLIGSDALAMKLGWVLARDHISLFGTGALAGPNDDRTGPRFPNLRGMYLVPGQGHSTGVVLGVPSISLATGAELRGFPCDALVPRGVLDMAIVAGHGGARVALALRCRTPEVPASNDFSFLNRMVQEIEGGEE